MSNVTPTVFDVSTTSERVQFVRNRIEERKAFAATMRCGAIGNSVDGARQCLKLAEIAEAMASAQETVLKVLFP